MNLYEIGIKLILTGTYLLAVVAVFYFRERE